MFLYDTFCELVAALGEGDGRLNVKRTQSEHQLLPFKAPFHVKCHVKKPFLSVGLNIYTTLSLIVSKKKNGGPKDN